MSAEALSKLSIGDSMVTTRAAAARARTAPPQRSQMSPSASPVSSPTPSLIESDDGHVYNVSTFDHDLRRRAKMGLLGDNEISMKFCKEIEDEPKRYLFHLEDDITVAMHGGRAPKCSCGANEAGKACKHIFWMLGQLTSAAPKTQPIELQEDGSSVRNIHPADIIDRSSLADVANHLEWTYQDDQMPDEDEMLDEIANMLSVFEPTEALPSEFKSEETPELTEQARKYRKFGTLLSQYAMRNPAYFLELQTIIPPAYQSQVFFTKINNRIDRVFKALGEYISVGPDNTTSEALDVRTCAARLENLVEAISNYYDEQYDEEEQEDEPSTDVAVLTAAALIRILDEVSRRDYDAYDEISWGPMPPTESRDNNLFVCLMRPTADGEGLFVLQTLLTLPQEILLRHYVELLDIEERLGGTPNTPPAYMDTLRTFLHENRKRAASESGGSAAKRPTT
ncbi:hypothetical protein P280DRAFT_392675 [Massarina eburnea CBS 473.64]|uniref:SWIM-type domain-containing protein n=1 Tax=Massarina eburnea CBS 473.64 TaxID=1395130 RepID=A0A6A6SDC7_9PLEO|nr:hypothetical protein P280DRAFT_392675 [Massarina eburnea CBS 473.64]